MREAFDDLLTWGGFPEVLLAQSHRRQRVWHRQRRELLVRQDLRDMSRIQLLSHVEELVELLVLRAGGILSYNALRQDLQVAIDSVRLWVNYLRRLFFIYLVRPYAGKLARALRREPKIYLWDWSEIDERGARFENMVASHLLKWCHFSQDWGLEPLDLHFLRDKEKREVDFLVTRNGKPWLLVETKLRSTRPGHALTYFGQRLNVAHRLLVVAGLDRTYRDHDVTVMDGPSFLAALPV